MRSIFLTISMYLGSQVSFACGSFTESVAVKLSDDIRTLVAQRAGSSQVDFTALPQVCKIWDRTPDVSIIAVPYEYDVLSGIGNQKYLGLSIAIVEEKKKLTLATFNENKLLVVDTIQPTEIQIDTANYKIRRSTREFGIRIVRENYLSASKVHEEFMDLYINDSGKIKKVLNGIVTSFYNAEGNGCDLNGVDKKTSLMIDTTETNDYHDLIANRKISHFTSSAIGSVCNKANGELIMERHVLKFNGSEYQIPKTLKAPIN